MKVEYTSVLLTLVGLLSTACVRTPESRGVIRTHHSVASNAYFNQEPPLARFEPIPAPPSRDHHWAAGHWRWDRGSFVWVPGCYQVRSRSNVVWVDGLWTRDAHGWYWVEGHWR
jgi:hypothetical protein